MDRRTTGGEADWPGRETLYDLAACLRFYSRLPVPQLPGEADPHRSPDFARLPRVLPITGAIVALPSALVLAGGWLAGLGPFLAATLAVVVGVLVTGALHEDGLADVADGFGGGASRVQVLEIMRDSRIGSYGTVALILALALRIGALATLLDRIGLAAATALTLASALSRLAALTPLAILPPARTDGLSAAVGRPDKAALAMAVATGLLLAVIALPLGLPALGVAAMMMLGATVTLVLTRLTRARIGGQTGDVIGACQQVAEIAGLLGLVAAVAP